MVREEIFGKTENGVEVYKFVFSNRGTEAEITNYGASVISLRRVGFNGDPVDIVCGYPTLSGYEKDRHYLGATVGRTSGRIAGGRFVLNGKTVLLNKNDGENHLHGGIQGFNKKVWNVYEVWKNGVSFRYNSPDGEENYPGLLKVRADFYITSDGSFNIEYGAESNKTTLCDITNHIYLNMEREGAGNIERNLLRIYSHRFKPVGESVVREGMVKAVEGTHFGFNFFTERGKE